MKITFVSNYLNHHQIPFCLAMQKLCEGQFYFVALQKMSASRIKLGWAFEEKYDFEIKAWQSPENKAVAQQLIDESNVVIYGGGPYATFVKKRISQNKLTFLYSERVYKRGLWRVVSPRGQYYLRRDNTRNKNKNLYLLAASAYAPFDFSLVGAYKNKAFKWGYFPQTYKYIVQEFFDSKKHNITELLWVSRFIPWKHAEKVIYLAKKLKKAGYNFHINMIGIGQLQVKIEQEIKSKGLQEQISLLGSMPPASVREYMEKANIFLFTSDYNEGWGAVLNESMNSGCAVVASHAIGAAPYLITHGENGLLYKNSSNRDFYIQVKKLLDNPAYAEELGKNAYHTITTTWNAEKAAENLIALCAALHDGKSVTIEKGPCSRAPIIPQSCMYKRAVRGDL